jgi:hypothetical protein
MDDGVFELRNFKINLKNGNGSPLSDEVTHLMLTVPSPTTTPAITNAFHGTENEGGETKEGSNITVIINVPNAQKYKNNTPANVRDTSPWCMKNCGKCNDDSSEIDTLENKFLSSDANVSNRTIPVSLKSDDTGKVTFNTKDGSSDVNTSQTCRISTTIGEEDNSYNSCSNSKCTCCCSICSFSGKCDTPCCVCDCNFYSSKKEILRAQSLSLLRKNESVCALLKNLPSAIDRSASCKVTKTEISQHLKMDFSRLN